MFIEAPGRHENIRCSGLHVMLMTPGIAANKRAHEKFDREPHWIAFARSSSVLIH
ncbi:hypothetical protein OZL92_14580 [Bacillus sonorensis]|uniref:Uncharacterized protein n=1 Tax=Bacillus sonorensis TaxID=119858 RepID=A0ABM6LNT6_9BACI|nr:MULTISPECIES: hypothetical protein [Bacillus]TWK75313.1 hypothetical protein CHCC20335_1045 [Bacillus paralicheniformis]ASB91019.1 hypothetical protein S101395_04531 [Bacillus sonorensis]MCF7619821.1 hypothetical protein [Bacillus sonorensis]MCY7858330.1 hypothetical protein [Bacillus sonorensis]MCY8027555.1 hypothetical protein [Bacillus sonorensis]